MKVVNFACMCAIVGSLSLGNLGAWERTALNNCKTEAKNCTKSPERCKENEKECKLDVVDDDTTSFASHLSPYSRALFRDFSPEQKKKALDAADRNKMSPDDAVAKIANSER